jgi:hypothetical protein
MTVLTDRIAVLLAALAVFFSCTQGHATHISTEIRTLNFDFGNAGAYVGDDGVLSSPGGTHWNEVRITSFPPASGIGTQFHTPTLRDEFGHRFGLGVITLGDQPYILPALHSFSYTGHETVAAGSGPLNDGVSLEVGDSLIIRELTSAVPIDLVIYFNHPDPSSPLVNSISVNTLGGGGFTKSTLPLGPFGGFFPGFEGFNYLRFSNLSPIPTTLGEPELPGIIIQAPQGGMANIAAIQIRGEFIFATPEPGSLTMTISAGCFAGFFRRRKAPGWLNG